MASPDTKTSSSFRFVENYFHLPVSGWRRRSRGIMSSGLFFPLTLLIGTMLIILSAGLLLFFQPQHRIELIGLQLGALAIGAGAIWVLHKRIQQHLMSPLAHLRHWAIRMRSGNLSARIPVPKSGEFAELANDINSLGESLKSLSREMDIQVQRQTQRIAQKTRSLEILYDVAASMNMSIDLDDLLTRFLTTLKEIVGAEAAVVRLATEDGRMRMVASLGLSARTIDQERSVPVQRCLCGEALSKGAILCQRDISRCGEYNDQPFFQNSDIEMVAVPLQYRGRNLGVYNLFVAKENATIASDDMQDLLTTIGQHLGMAIEKAALDSESKRLTIMQERALLANELHDSLAQTLASLRFQIRMLEQTIGLKSTGAANEAANIKSGLDQANAQLRELIAHFRIRMDERGLIPAVQELVNRFGRETGITVYFQNEVRDLQLPPHTEVQVLHIVQEAMANIRKHSQAQTVRVLLRNEPRDQFLVLVEDDGLGMDTDKAARGKPGEHVGLTIMQERAKRIGGELFIESEPGEGTRVELHFACGECVDKQANDTSQQQVTIQPDPLIRTRLGSGHS